MHMSPVNAVTLLMLLPHLLVMYDTIRDVMDTRARLIEARLEARQRHANAGAARTRTTGA
jgi:hypothetical protein